jgi:energy-coupling factor transporter transmembrane protein EcfT
MYQYIIRFIIFIIMVIIININININIIIIIIIIITITTSIIIIIVIVIVIVIVIIIIIIIIFCVCSIDTPMLPLPGPLYSSAHHHCTAAKRTWQSPKRCDWTHGGARVMHRTNSVSPRVPRTRNDKPAAPATDCEVPGIWLVIPLVRT